MREILFRGKHIRTGEWVYGDLYHIVEDGLMFSAIHTVAEVVDEILDIDPITVGQSTGLKDKNGTKIFEGDIIRSYSMLDDVIIHSIQWDDQNASFGLFDKHGSYSGRICQAWIDEREKEVIGNIHNNPELMQ